MIGYQIIFILMAHFVADFIFQTDEMAKNKSTSIYWLSKHAFTYGLVLSIVILIGGLFTTHKGAELFIFGVLNGLLHWVVDFGTSKWTSRLWKEKKVHEFFVVIGFDQLIHQTILILTYLMIF